MKREQIERLAIDSTAGELNEDAEALLKEYLSEHAPENQWAQDISELYKMTRQTIETKTARTIQKTSKVTHKHTSWKLNFSAVARWAAVIVIFTSIGAGLGRWSKKPEPISETVKIIISNPSQRVRPADLVLMPTEGFWRDKAVSMLTSRPVTHYDKKIPISQLWHEYKQYIKEKSYD
ncbi:MAG: hypothetical protein ACYTE8_07750 [Planctomycetota bacterium]|jgi:hypothetical protein